MKLPLTVALIDADRFKPINDRHGHAAGDTVLRELASCCRDSVRSHDMVGRYGGEEFLLVMPNTSAEQAKAVLDRVRANVAAMPMPLLTDRFHLTVSIGASQVEARDANIAAAVTRADLALYRAKEKGRNRVAIDAAS